MKSIYIDAPLDHESPRDIINLCCAECGGLIEVSLETAQDIWEIQENTGELLICAECPDAYQKAQLEYKEKSCRTPVVS